jgi:CubicO group peptidase (beta-lactamase class C family)
MIDKSILDTIPDEAFRRVCEKAVAAMNRLPIPGAVVGITYQDKEFIAGLGTTSVEHPLPVTPDTLFQIGSITKTYLATAVMRLVEMGKLQLEEPVRTYLPGLKLADETVAARVTMRHLLTHTGGWVGDYFDDLGLGDDALANIVAKMADLEQITPLGEIWSYNNSGFYIAGRVIEVVTGKSFEAALQELVFDPLDLKKTFFFAHDVITHRFAVGHEVIDAQPVVARPWAIGRAAHPAGGIVCAMQDLLRYARFQMGGGLAPNGTRLLSAQSLARMQTPLFPTSGLSMSGLTWSIIPLDGAQTIGHGGGTNGQTTLLRMAPASNFAVAVFTNSDEGGSLCTEVTNAALQQYLGLAQPEAIPLDLPEDKLLAYAGTYEAAADVCELTIRAGGLVLQLTPKGGFPTPASPPTQAPPPVRAALYAADRLIVLDEPMQGSRGEFLRGADNRIAWLRFGGRVHARRG